MGDVALGIVEYHALREAKETAEDRIFNQESAGFEEMNKLYNIPSDEEDFTEKLEEPTAKEDLKKKIAEQDATLRWNYTNRGHRRVQGYDEKTGKPYR